jgi:hypothetical protein
VLIDPDPVLIDPDPVLIDADPPPTTQTPFSSTPTRPNDSDRAPVAMTLLQPAMVTVNLVARGSA